MTDTRAPGFLTSHRRLDTSASNARLSWHEGMLAVISCNSSI